MLFGRESECARIDELLGRAQTGRSAALAFQGEPGIGKTALLDYAAERGEGMTIVRALGVESEAELEFSGLLEVSRPLLDQLGEIPERQAKALAGALGLEPAEVHDRFVIGAATLSLLAAAAERRPVLVIVDDAHWLDRSSQDALLFAIKRLQADRILLLYGAREGEERVFAAPGVDSITLRGLSRDAATQLLRARSDVVIAPPVADRLYEETGGNPLALIELPSLLPTDQLAGLVPLDSPLPAGSSIERAFVRRAEGLDDGARTALLLAAVSASGAFDTIAAALGTLGLDVSALESAEDAGLVRLVGGRVEFRHSLARSVVYHSAAPSDRRAAHRAFVDACADPCEEECAWHLAAAALGPDEAVASALETAAEEARLRSGFAAAAAAYERAARLTPAESPRLRRLFLAADASWQAGRGERALELVNEGLERCDEPRLRADMLHLLGYIQHFGGPVIPAHRLLLEAAGLIENVDPAKAVAILSDAFEACLYAGETEGMLHAGQRARALSPRDGGSVDFLAEVTLAEALFFNGQAAEGAPLFERSLALFRENSELTGNPMLVTRAAIALEWLERSGEAHELGLQAVRLARDLGATAAVPYALFIVAWSARQLGFWQEDLAATSEAETLARETGQMTLLGECLSAQAFSEAARGAEADCRRHAHEATRLAELLMLGLTRERAQYAIGLLELGLGRLEEAARHLRASVDRLGEMGMHMFELAAAPDLVETLVRLGRLDEARDALSFVRAGSSPATSEALVARSRGLVADEDKFDAQFARSLELFPEDTHVFEQARTRLCFGERLRRAGRRIEAREQLRAALGTFERLGAEPWAERARGELRATGETLRRREPHEAEELTPQELQIALQVAEGKSNKEVGAALFLSHKTVEFHLGRIYRKLDIRSRAELIRRFVREAVPASP